MNKVLYKRPPMINAFYDLADRLRRPQSAQDSNGSVMSPNGVKRIARDLAIVLAVVLALTLPFIFKPVQLDGIYFLDMAKAKMETPWRDSIPDYDFGGLPHDRFRDTHPPFTASYLALVVWTTGTTMEPVLHLSFLPFALLAGGAAYLISRRFVRQPLFAALLTVAAPGFVVMAGNLMSDVPVMAFWLATVAAYIYGVERNSRLLLAGAGLFLILAVFTAYEALSLIPLILLFLFLNRKLSLKNVLPLAGAFAIFTGYTLIEWALFSELPRLKVQRAESVLGPGLGRFFPKTTSVLLFLGGTIVFPLVPLVAFWPRAKQAFEYFLIAILLALTPLLISLMGAFPFSQAIQMTFLLPAAGILLWGMFNRLRDGGSRQGWIFLAIWLFGVLFYMALILFHASVKYLLPAFLPVCLLIADQAYRRFNGTRFLRPFQAASVVLTAALALLLGVADYQLAAAWRDFSNSGDVTERQEEGTTWYTGEFGFRYYIRDGGSRYLLSDDTRPQRGDIIFQPYLPGPVALDESVAQRVNLLEERFIEGSIPIRIINTPAGAGFYGHRWGLLPYSFSRVPLDRVLIYEVAGEVCRLGPEQTTSRRILPPCN